MFSGHWWRSRVERDGFVIVDVKYVICGIFLPSNSSVTKVYAQSTFYPPVCSPHSAPSLHFTLSLQSAFYPRSAVCILHWPNISDNPVMVASSVTPTIYGLTQYTRIFYYVLLPGIRKTDYLGYFKSCFHYGWARLWLREKTVEILMLWTCALKQPKHKRNFHENEEPCTKILLHNAKLQK